MRPILERSRRNTAIVATVICLAGLAAAASAPANPLTTAGYHLEAKDGSTIQRADCMTDQRAAKATFCQFLVARNDGSTPAKSGSETLQWLRDARTLGAAKVVFTEAGDGFTGTTSYTVPASDTSPYTFTSVGSYPPSTHTTTSKYEITSIDAEAADTDCINGRDRAPVQAGPYGRFCALHAMRPSSHTRQPPIPPWAASSASRAPKVL